MVRNTILSLRAFEVLVLGSLLCAKLPAAIPLAEAICVFQGDHVVLGTVDARVDYDTNSYTLRELAKNEVSLLSKTPLKLLSKVGSFTGTLDGSSITVSPCTVVGTSFYAELNNAVFNLSSEKAEEASGTSYVMSDESIKEIALKYVSHCDTFTSIVYHPEEIRRNRLRLLPFLGDKDEQWSTIMAGAKQEISAKIHTIDVMWANKKCFTGKAAFEHNGNEKRHREVLLGCALQELFRIPFPEIENVENGNVMLRSSDVDPPFSIVIDNRISATLIEVKLVPHTTEPNRYQISPLMWPRITERLIETRNLYYFKILSDDAKK